MNTIYRTCTISLLFVTAICVGYSSCAQPLNQKKVFTRQDSLRGTITPERAWWNVVKYDLVVAPDFAEKKISGSVKIVYNVLNKAKGQRMQIDLQEPMKIDRVTFENAGRDLSITRDGNVYYIENAPSRGSRDSITINFSGYPVIAANPPWDGGWIFTKDANGQPWMTVACQGLGASVWYPCKDHQSDEPDEGASITVKVSSDLVAVANGRLTQTLVKDNSISYTWQVSSPINNYNIVPYIGKYVKWSDEFTGENGKKLTMDYWVMNYNLEKSKAQFGRDVKPMLQCFEHWFGPYPFYEDGYKLVESPHLGMEHQSAVAYGNHYKDGYLGMDLSGSGWGKKWDYIIIHESGHEWFANNISTKDIADMWVHEGFTDYSEVLFVECQYGQEAANEYCQGLRRNIRNDIPVIGHYGVNQEGSGDMYAKGANMLHTIRQVINDDEKFRQILRGLNKTFWHQTVTTKQVEEYMSTQAGKDLSKIFDQYLRTTQIPVLEYAINGDKISYQWTNCVDGFDMPVRLQSGEWIKPTTVSSDLTATAALVKNFAVDKNFYIKTKKRS